jgi:toxoflavin biosynthesis protein ToxC
MIAHLSPISGISSFENRYIATAGYDNQVILWDAQKKESIARGLHDHLANQCRFSNDGRYLVSSSSDHTARVWQVPDMKLIAVLGHHEDDVESVAVSDDDRYIATCSRDHRIRTFTLDGQLIATLVGHQQDVISVEWISNSEELISSSDDGTVKRWHGLTGALLQNIDLGEVETDTLIITKEGVIFAANDDGNIISIDGNQQQVFTAHKAGIKRLVYSPSEQSLVSLSYDRQVKIWSITSPNTIKETFSSIMPSVIWPRSCCFVGNRQLAFATFGDTFALLDLITGEWETKHIEPTWGINAVLETDKGIYTVGDAGVVKLNGLPIQSLPSLCNFLTRFDNLILTGGQTGQIFDAISGTVIYQHHSPLNCATVYRHPHLDHTQVAVVGTYTGDVIVIEKYDELMGPKANNFSAIQKIQIVKIQDNAIKSLANDGELLFSVSATGQAAWHRVNSFECVHEAPEAHEKIANGCTYLSPNRFASISRDLKLRIWDGVTPEVIPSPHSFSIKCITSTQQGRFIGTGSYGGFVAIWDTLRHQWIKTLRPTVSGISNMVEMVHRRGFWASAYDGKVYPVYIEEK